MRSIGSEIKSIIAHTMNYSYSSSHDHCRSEKPLLSSVKTPLHVRAFELVAGGRWQVGGSRWQVAEVLQLYILPGPFFKDEKW